MLPQTETGHRQRVRDKFTQQRSFEGWHDYEIVELLLMFVLPRIDTKPIAKELLSRFKTLPKLLHASPDELQDVPGIGPQTGCFLTLVRELMIRYHKVEVRQQNYLESPERVIEYLTVLLGHRRDEAFLALFLNSTQIPIHTEILHTGIVTESHVYPRKIVELACRFNAVSVICAHNHPEGIAEPSQADIETTNAIQMALNTVDISILDHIIIGETGYFSFREHHLLDEE